MELFSSNFDKPGSGIEKNAPHKRGIPLLLEIVLREFWSLIKLNMIFILTCLPIVTIGAAWGAMTKVNILMIRDLPTDIWYEYWRAFRQNWKFSTLFYVLSTLSVVGSLLMLFVYTSSSPLWIFVFAVLLFWGMCSIYMYPMLTSTTLSVKDAIRNMLLLPVVQLPYSLPATLFLFGILFLELLYFPLSLPIMLFIGFSIPNLIITFAAWGGIRRFILRENDDSPTNF